MLFLDICLSHSYKTTSFTSVGFPPYQLHLNCRADAQTSTRRWPTEDWEQSAMKADAAAHNLTLQIIYISCDLKSAASLVKTAEMRSSLLTQKLQFIADHQRQLEASFALPSLPSLNN